MFYEKVGTFDFINFRFKNSYHKNSSNSTDFYQYRFFWVQKTVLLEDPLQYYRALPPFIRNVTIWTPNGHDLASMAEGLLYRRAELQGISLIMKMKAFLRITILFLDTIQLTSMEPNCLKTTTAVDISRYTATLKVNKATKLQHSCPND